MKLKYRYVNKNKDRKNKISLRMVFIPFAILVAAMGIFTMIQMTATGAEIAKFEKEERQLLEANKQLSEEIIKISSLNNAGDSAENLGFSAPISTVYISSVPEVAVKLP